MRLLRGVETQEAFSERLGITRSSLANYETGRSVPNQQTIEKVAEALGLPIAYFQSPDFGDTLSLVSVLGSVHEGIQDVTDDEISILRILRLVSRETAQSVLGVLVAGFEKEATESHHPLLVLFATDLARVLTIHARGGAFNRGGMVLTDMALRQQLKKLLADTKAGQDGRGEPTAG